METGQQKTLRGWKEIATYVGRDVRTVQRWEARRGFPVSRLPGGDGGNVYILASEVDQWLHSSTRSQPFETVATPSDRPLIAPVSSDEALYGAAGEESLPADVAIDAAPPMPPMTGRSFRTGFRRWLGLGAMAVALAVATLGLFRFHQERVQARATPARDVELPRHAAPSAEVDQLYLQGMYLFEKRTPESLLEAKQALLKVTAEDPDHAPSWSGLAEVSTLLYEYGIEIDPGATVRARAAAERALALDPGMAEPHAVLGFGDFFWNGNARAAESEFQNALRLDPSSALVRSWYGTFLTYEARYPEALEQLNRAQRMQPSSTAILSNRALALGLSGHREMAMQLLEKAGGDKSIANVQFNLALLALMRPCNVPVFLHEEMALAAMTHSDGQYRFYAAAQEAYRRGGEPAMWRSIVATGEGGPAAAVLLAGAHAALGENDAALDVLANAHRKSGTITDLAMHPLLLPLHRDPRFRQMLNAEGLQPVS